MSAEEPGRDVPNERGRPIQWAALIVAILFLAAGVLGFIPGATSNFMSMRFAGHHSTALLLGLFQVSILHNIVHLLFGIVGALVRRSPAGSFHYLLWGGIVYAALWLYGLFIGAESGANFVPLNTPDNWLHFGLAIVMIGSALVVNRRRFKDR